jgi:hypothetical protein
MGLPIVDGALAHLAKYEGLEELSLRKAKVVGTGLKFVTGLTDMATEIEYAMEQVGRRGHASPGSASVS